MFVFHFLLFISYSYSLSVQQSISITPYEISYNQDQISDLHNRLDRTIWPDQLDLHPQDWSFGMPLHVIRRYAQELREFNWERKVQQLNSLPHFLATFQNKEEGEGEEQMKIHFLHARSPSPHAQPLLLVHGWPGSFFECHKLLSLLTEPNNSDSRSSFHLICPSLPGYVYSQKPRNKGMDQRAAARLFDRLMTALGYDRYFIQGGDWGSVVASFQAALPGNEKRVIGLHLNMVPVAAPLSKGLGWAFTVMSSLFCPWLFYSKEERNGLLKLPLKMLKETGYFHEQSTRPQTLAYGLADSPVGLLSWMLEKFYSWSDGGAEELPLNQRFETEELLTNFMLYWSTNSIASSMRFYFEFVHGSGGGGSAFMDLLNELEVKVPTGVAIFPKEVTVAVQLWASAYYKNIVQWELMEKGGHFAALEQPQLLANELKKFRHIIETNEQKKDL